MSRKAALSAACNQSSHPDITALQRDLQRPADPQQCRTTVATVFPEARTVREQKLFHIDAWVVLPDHLHCLLTLPPGDADHSRRWKAIKTAFAKVVPREESLSEVRRANQERSVWQRRFWEHTIRDDRDYAAHMDYICFNPVKHGWVAWVVDWPYSSFHRHVQAGIYPVDWGGGEVDGVFGERGSD